jgi:hypothetical protein
MPISLLIEWQPSDAEAKASILSGQEKPTVIQVSTVTWHMTLPAILMLSPGDATSTVSDVDMKGQHLLAHTAFR